jgi:uncharacterized membrane protein
MEDTTLFLAQLIGPTMLAVGLGIFFSRNYYTKVYRNLENETLAVLMSGIAALVIGIVMVMNHNIWNGFVAIVVTLVGWLSIAKGLVLIIIPRTLDRVGDKLSGTAFFPFIGGAYALLGAFISYAAYLA